MNSKNLVFCGKVDGKKPHFIFSQDGIYYVMTTMDKDLRGNFFAIQSHELKRLKTYLVKNSFFDFHPKDVSLYREIHEESYRSQRIRSLCYILVFERDLELKRVGREIHFQMTRKLFNNEELNLARKITSSNTGTSQKKKETVICPLCLNPIKKQNIETHKIERCSKRKII